ncbi:MFS transporter [Temperatibacter marinus]|uniref:MFS transporter n=1 Tax=Temperatibacter marinus TaxID=1456591 RepID=A0AA52H9K4_9PROT|nr:MFS transporter [Temperatibacter marinus]WND03009.1 MFS transporter [Temperatibacter marinus]
MADKGKPSVFTKISYGIGAVAFGVKNNGFDYFLLIFYSQVLGVDAPLVGLALLIALIFDAISDPIVGYLSDNTKSRWGRRHPWMFAAALPAAVAYYFLWSPPESMTGNDLFPYLVTLSVAIRLLITFYEIPSSALAAELTKDYDERTSLMSYRMSFGWISGTVMAIFVLTVLLASTEAYPVGILNKEAYSTYGLVAACVIGGAILLTTFGTAHLIPDLPKGKVKESKGLSIIFNDFKKALANKSFAALLVASIVSSVIIGMAFSLNLYMNTFFWGFNTDQIGALNLSFIIAAMISFFMAPYMSRKFGKKKAVFIYGVLTLLITPVMIGLRVMGVLPENGDPSLFPILFIVAILDVTMFIGVQTLMYSMVAELVEHNEVKNNDRTEGIYFSAISFSRKASHGLGVMAASIVIAVANFPKGAKAEDIDKQAILDLGISYAVAVVLLWLAVFYFLKFFKIDRESHLENLSKLAEREKS